MRKYLIMLGIIVTGLIVSTNGVFAAPFNAANNPNIVDNFPDGLHTIVGEQDDLHYGMDVVMERGNSGKFQQWFVGTSEGEGFHGEHSVWNTENNNTNEDQWIKIPNAYPGWGIYLLQGVTYIVNTNQFLNGLAH